MSETGEPTFSAEDIADMRGIATEMNRVTVVFDDGSCVTTDYWSADGWSRACKAYGDWRDSKKVLFLVQLSNFEIVSQYHREER